MVEQPMQGISDRRYGERPWETSMSGEIIVAVRKRTMMVNLRNEKEDSLYYATTNRQM